jgi:hypothetical protein
MVNQEKFEKLIQEQVFDRHRKLKHESVVSTDEDTVGELINALDALLLERAAEEHRVALSRLNQLKQALGPRGSVDPKK